MKRFPDLTLLVSRDLTHSTLELSSSFSYKGPKSLEPWVDAYLQGTHLPLQLPLNFPPFTKRVLESLLTIPFGQTFSYKQLATHLGNEKAARAVGSACHNNPLPLLIPCHRIISAHHKIGGFALHLEIKRRLLQFEKNPYFIHNDG